MPYLQLDLPEHYDAATKRKLAARLGTLYADVMQTRRSMVNVGFRELGPDNLYRCGDGEPGPGMVVMCDIRRGRPAEQRLRLAEGIRAICEAELGFGPNQVVVQFTQHAADEMYRDGGWGREFTSDEATPGSYSTLTERPSRDER